MQKEYRIISHKTPQGLETAVKARMLAGWKPVGGVAVSVLGFAQAMVAYVDPDEVIISTAPNKHTAIKKAIKEWRGA